jgi:hypothetical protein
MKKLSKELTIETIIDYSVDYKHLIDSYYNDEGDFVVNVCLLNDNPKDVGEDVYDDLNNDKKLLKFLNNVDVIVKLIISSPYSLKRQIYEI